MIMSHNSNKIPQVQAKKGLLASVRGSIDGVTSVTDMVTEMKPLVHQTFDNVNQVASQVDALSSKATIVLDDLAPEISGAARAMQNTSRTFQDLGDKFGKVIDTAQGVAANAEGVMSQLRLAFSPVEIKIMGKNIVPTLMKVARIIANFAMAADGCKIASLLLNITSEFGNDICDLIRNLLFTPKLSDLPVGFSQSTEALAGLQSWLSENKAVTTTGFAAVLAVLMQIGIGLPPPSKRNVEDSIKFFGDRCRGMKGMVDFGRSSWSIFSSIADWILGIAFPGVQVHALDEYVKDYGKWAAEVRGLHTLENPFHQRVKKDKSLIYKVEKLYRKGLEFSIAIGKMHIAPEMRDHYQKHWKLIQDFQKVADYSGVLGNKPRPKPLMVHLFGESGVGKSGATWPLASDFNAAVCDTIEQASDIAAEVYFRNTEQEFWDGYAGQNICVYDDFGQRADTTAKPNEEFMELIRVGNVAAYPLHMAELQEKSRTKFISKFVILTSNVLEMKVSSLTFPSAFRRRIDVCAKVEVKPEFSKEGFNADTGAKVMRLDTSKCDGSCDTRPYLFKLYNAESKQLLSDDKGAAIVMEYDEFLAYCLSLARSSFEQSYNFNDALTSRITNDRFQQLRQLMHSDLALGRSEMKYDVKQDSFVDEDNEPFSYDDAVALDEFNGYLESWHSCTRMTLLKKHVKSYVEQVKQFFTLKSALVLVGSVLGGLAIWKLFKVVRSRKTSKEESQTEVKMIASEAQFANHRSKAVSKALRHQMKSIDGFHTIDDLLRHLRVLKMTREELLQIVESDTKNRFMIQGDRIRANQGHSYEIDPSKIFTPSAIGWATHFTHEKCLPSIEEEGILRMNRDWVHLYPGIHTTLPAHFSGRSAYVHVDLSKCSGEVWETSNGYVHVKHVPTSAITKVGLLGQRGRSPVVSEASSGDNKTSQMKSVVTENSGDNKTSQLRNISTENSGDNKTGMPKTVATEASVSGDNTTRKMTRVVTEMSHGTSEMWADRSAQELITYRILNNLYRIEIDGVDCLNGLFIRDTIMLTCQHLMRRMRNGKVIRIWNMRGSVFEMPISVLKTCVITNREGEDKDAMLIQFPRYVNGHSDLVKHFQTMPELAARRAEVCLPLIRKLRDDNLFYVLGNQSAEIKTSKFQELVDGKMEIRHFRDSLQYKANTTFGDCGAPVIVNDTSFIRKIAGIHSSALQDNSGISIGQSVTQADLERGMKQLITPIIQDADELPNIVVPDGCVQMGVGYSQEDLIREFDLPGPTFGHVGKCSRTVVPPGKTDLRASAMYGFVAPTTKPAYLYRSDCNLVHKNVGKNALNTPFIPSEEVDRAVAEVRPLLLSGESRKRLAKIYSFEEAVSGSSDSEYIAGIARQTSPGYPWVLDRISGMPGKTTWFGTDEWVYPDDIKEIVLTRIENAKLGKRLPVVWSDTLKDERRPIAKVDQLKTRVFSHGPMDYTIAVRMYFIGFVAHIMENRIDNEQSIGTNPFGADWGRTARKLNRHGKKVFAGDFSQFDGTLNSCILEKFADLANDFYNDGPENAMVRKTLMADVYNSVHLCDGKYIQLTHSQPSGNPLTTILNSFYNSVSMRIAYYRCFNGKAPPFIENVSMVSYGDDNVINISANISDMFNQNTVTRAYETFGMIYTDESKSGGEVAPWRNLEDVAYLKRGFRKEDGEWLAPLAMDTILESCNWIRKCSDPIEALKQNVEGAFRELAQYDEQTFNKQTKMICNAFYSATDVFPELKTRLAYLEDTETPFF